MNELMNNKNETDFRCFLGRCKIEAFLTVEFIFDEIEVFLP